MLLRRFLLLGTNDDIQHKIQNVVPSSSSASDSATGNWNDYTTFSGRYQEISSSNVLTVNLSHAYSVMEGQAYTLSFHYMTNYTEFIVTAGSTKMNGYQGQSFTSEILNAETSDGVVAGNLDISSDVAVNNALDVNQGAYYFVSFRATSTGPITIQLKKTVASIKRSIFRIDNFQLATIYQGVGGTSNWQESSDRCSSRGLQLCTQQDYCPHGPGTSPIGGSFLTRALTSTSAVHNVERWVPFANGGLKYNWLKVESSMNDPDTVGKTCNDHPPPGLYSCSEYVASGDCSAAWMHGHCCQSCSTCSSSCVNDQVSWIKGISNGGYGSDDIGKDAFDGLFAVSSGGSDITLRIVARVCFDCTDINYRLLFYRRITKIPRAFSIYDLLTSNFNNDGNVLNVDFELYTSYTDAVARNNKWTSCGYGTAVGIGFPGTCGVTASSTSIQWNSHDGSASGGISNYAYYIKASPIATCVVNTTDVHTTGSSRQSSDHGVENGAPQTNFPIELTGDYMCCANSNACDAPLGMESGAIADAQLSDTGASILSQKRLNVNVDNANGWIFPGPAGLLHPFGSSYYQVDLLHTYSISGIGTQGRGDKNQWVSSYTVSYTEDTLGLDGWKYVTTLNVNTNSWYVQKLEKKMKKCSSYCVCTILEL